MAQRAGRVGVNPADVDPVTGHVNVEVPGNVYTKTQVDNKFLTKTKAASDYQTKELAVPIQLLDGSALLVEDALQGLNSQKQDKHVDVITPVLEDGLSFNQTSPNRSFAIGSLKVISMTIDGLSAEASTWTQIATIPSDYLPDITAGTVKFFAKLNGLNHVLDAELFANGIVKVRDNSGAIPSSNGLIVLGIYN